MIDSRLLVTNCNDYTVTSNGVFPSSREIFLNIHFVCNAHHIKINTHKIHMYRKIVNLTYFVVPWNHGDKESSNDGSTMVPWYHEVDRFHYRDYQFYQKDWVLNNLSLREEDNFHLLSAVLAGDNTLEMRVLSPYDITITEEIRWKSQFRWKNHKFFLCPKQYNQTSYQASRS